jgi:cytochrome c biogenesis factor
MIKKKKIALFRELYHEIEALLESYFYKDVAVILREKHGLEVTAGTLKNYVFQHRQFLSSVEVDSETENDHTVLEDQENSEIAKTGAEAVLAGFDGQVTNTAPSEKISLADIYASLGEEKKR